MKKRNLTILLAAFVAFNACTDAPDADKATTSDAKEVAAATGAELKVDTTASKVEWIGTKVSGYHTGSIHIKNGVLRTSGDTLTGGNFVFDMKSMVVSGPEGSDAKSNEKLLGHLKSPDFFDVEKYPEATFEITSVRPFTGTVTDSNDVRQETISKYKVANPTHLIGGNLTMRGVTKNIEFPAKVSVSGNSVDATAKFNIDRTQWEIVYPGKPDDLIRKDIHLGIALKASK
jgi:polyisoprenoid-binding protein YceI